MKAKIPLLALALCASCVKKDSNSESTMRHVVALEERVGELEQKVSDLETRAPVWDSVAEGVTQLLAKLEDMPAQPKGPRQPDAAAVYRVSIKGEPFTGSKKAKVTLVYAYDFYCVYCDRVRPTLAKLQSKYGKDLKVVYKEFVIHQDTARQPALAACAANIQGKFTPMFNAIWKQGLRARAQLKLEDLERIGQGMGLNLKRMKRDMETQCEEEVTEDQRELASVGARGTPAFYINGRFLAGALPMRDFEAVINQELRKANAAIKSGVGASSYYNHIMKEAQPSL